MISIFDMVDTNGWILNLAVKKPAIEVNMTENKIQMTKARIALVPAPMELRSMILPKTVPVFGPLCITTVEMTMFIPTIRPMERSVPVSRINPATPKAKNIRGAACCMIFMTLLTVSRDVCLRIGVRMHSIMKTRRITIYRPFLRKNCFLLNEYLYASHFCACCSPNVNRDLRSRSIR